MDHKWGRNVTKYGLGSAGATLAARLLLTTGVIYTNAPGSLPGQFVVWLIHPDTELPFLAFNGTKLPGHPHFPYGYLVESDGPV